MPKNKTAPAFKPTFATMHQIDVPQSRNGKHRKIVEAILEDVDNLAPGEAVKVPIRALGDTKENVRAALSRESKKRKAAISTAADADHLYVWRNGH
jgi:predicted DNA-binding antitoxin AbrB/MazE fold protein